VDRKRLAGLVIGFAGVIALLGIDFVGNPAEFLGAGTVLLSALGYAGAALLYRRWLADARALGVTALMTVISGAAFLAPAATGLPRQVPPGTSVLALVVLGIVNTGLAYWLFYLLIDEAGAATASVITCVMPVVSQVAGLLGAERGAQLRPDLDPGASAPSMKSAMLPVVGWRKLLAGERCVPPLRSGQTPDSELPPARSGTCRGEWEGTGTSRVPGKPGTYCGCVARVRKKSSIWPIAPLNWSASNGLTM
jgi:EamA-like transporter family